MIHIKRGLNLPILGEPVISSEHKNNANLNSEPTIKQVALIADDYKDIKPSMHVKVGDTVKRGDKLFTDKNNPSLNFTAPAGGVICAINRGEKRALKSIIIDVNNEKPEEFVQFKAYSSAEIPSLSAEQIKEQLLQSGLWTAFKTRPFGKIPKADSKAEAIFITAIDTNPLAVEPRQAIKLLNNGESYFRIGVQILRKLTNTVYICQSQGGTWPGSDLPGVISETFTGVHPAGLPSTHIHFLRPASLKHVVWHLNYQDVAAIGELFATGILPVERVIALGGPVVKKPRLIKTRLGASLLDILANDELSLPNKQQHNSKKDNGKIRENRLNNLSESELATMKIENSDLKTQILSPENNLYRIISGSVFGGRGMTSLENGFLGRYHLQVSCLQEEHHREFFHYFRAGWNKFSVKNVFASKIAELFGSKQKYNFTTSTNGSPRAIIPIENYEAVMPLDILATPLLRYLICGDTDMAQKLGCLELDEEDLALCSFVCAGKYEYGAILRDNLRKIEIDG